MSNGENEVKQVHQESSSPVSAEKKKKDDDKVVVVEDGGKKGENAVKKEGKGDEDHHECEEKCDPKSHAKKEPLTSTLSAPGMKYVAKGPVGESANQLLKGYRDRGHSAGAKSKKDLWARKYRGPSACSENLNGESSIDMEEYDDFDMEEPFSESDDESGGVPKVTRPHFNLPMPRRRIRTLSGTIPPIGFCPVWGGPTMCLGCLEFFDLPNQTANYVGHLLEKHRIVVTDIELIVDLKRYVEHWRHRFGKQKIEEVFPKVIPDKNDPNYGKVDYYFLMSEKLAEDRQLRERLAMRRLEEVLSCQQRERDDRGFNRQCLFCRYRAKGNRSKLIHHLYMIHHLNLGSPDNLVFINEYLDLLKKKMDNNQCIYCEKQFAEHETLMEHMRKRQHREVNPKNNYYDKFYVINYLELGKRWLEVLAEDFEDHTPSFADSDEDEADDSWHEWVEDNAEESDIVVVCLFCDDSFHTAKEVLHHVKEEHQFDLLEQLKSQNLEFYERVKFMNYIRKMSYNCVCFVCGKDDLHSWQALRKHLADNNHLNSKLPAREKWDAEEFLVPVFENDHLIWVLESMLDEDGKEEIKAGENSTETKKEHEAEKKTDGEPSAEHKEQKEATKVEIIPEEIPELESILKDPELREQLK